MAARLLFTEALRLWTSKKALVFQQVYLCFLQLVRIEIYLPGLSLLQEVSSLQVNANTFAILVASEMNNDIFNYITGTKLLLFHIIFVSNILQDVFSPGVGGEATTDTGATA